MIKSLPNMPAGVIGFEVIGKLSADDYRAALDPILDSAAGEHKLRVVMVMGPDATGFGEGAMREDVKMGRRTWSAWERIAIVTDKHLVRDGIHLVAWAFPGDVKLFPLDAVDEAAAWASGS